MSTTITPRIIAIAASAVGVAGMVAVPVTASAEPACLDWRFAQDALFLNLDNRVRIGVPWLGGTNKVRTTQGASLLTSPDGGRWQGDIDPGGGTYQNDTIKFRINWNQFVGDQHPVSAFSGHIDPNGVASGTMVNEKNETNSWTAEGNFTCSARAAEPAAPAPKPADNNPPVEAKPVTATVNVQSDVYDAADGARIEDPFFLEVGRSLETVKPCAPKWCLLKIPDLPGGAHGDLPAGQGWVYAGDGFLTVK
jgi:hypothetical protein